MKMTKLFLLLASIGVLAISSDGSAVAGSAVATPALQVSVVVSNNCIITTVPVVFPAYDPIVTHTVGNPDHSTSGSVTITCNKGGGTSIALGLGAQPNAGQPRMANGTDFLNYKLYSDSTWSSLWSGAALTIAGAASQAPQTFSVYGEIPGGQPAVTGTYSDTVVATVNF
jgi:spore coat protein U-like protein